MINPYLKIPIVLPGNQEDQEGEKTVEARLQPEEIAIYYPGYHFGTLIYLRSGAMIMTRLKPEEVDFGIDTYWKNVKKKQDKEDRIQLFQS